MVLILLPKSSTQVRSRNFDGRVRLEWEWYKARYRNVGVAMCRNCVGCGGALLWLSGTGGFCSALGEADTVTCKGIGELNNVQAEVAVEGYTVWSKVSVMCSTRVYLSICLGVLNSH